MAFNVGGGDLARRLGNAGPRGSHRPPAPGCAVGRSPQALSSLHRDTRRGPPAHERLLPKRPLRRLHVRMCAPVGGLLAALAMVFGMAVAFAPKPRITWEHRGKWAGPALAVDVRAPRPVLGVRSCPCGQAAVSEKAPGPQGTLARPVPGLLARF